MIQDGTPPIVRIRIGRGIRIPIRQAIVPTVDALIVRSPILHDFLTVLIMAETILAISVISKSVSS